MRESQARVPNQLLPADGGDEAGGAPEEGVNEFCGIGTGAVMGFSEPLGAQRKKQQKRKK